MKMCSWYQAQLVRMHCTQLSTVAQTVERIAEHTTEELADATWEALLPKVREHIERLKLLLEVN